MKTKRQILNCHWWRRSSSLWHCPFAVEPSQSTRDEIHFTESNRVSTYTLNEWWWEDKEGKERKKQLKWNYCVNEQAAMQNRQNTKHQQRIFSIICRVICVNTYTRTREQSRNNSVYLNLFVGVVVLMRMFPIFVSATIEWLTVDGSLGFWVCRCFFLGL